MKQLIKSATVYKADFGTIKNSTDMHNALADHYFRECETNQVRSIGFIPPSESCTMAAEFDGGFAFRVRVDEKQIPSAVLKAKTGELAKNFIETEGRNPNKTERETLKDAALYQLVTQAFPRTAVITYFYQQATGYLIVPTTSQKLTDIITTALVKAAGSVKTETIHVNDVKHGLTTRLKEWANGEDGAFGVFDPCASAALQQGKRKIGITMGSLEGAYHAIKEALASSFQVTSIGFTHDGNTEFRLAHDFKLKSIKFSHTDSEDDEEPSFYAQATLEVDAVSAVITDLIDMIGHGKEEAAQGEEPTGEPAK